MLPEIEKIANNNLNRWSRQTSVEMKEASAKLISQMITRLLCILLHENSLT